MEDLWGKFYFYLSVIKKKTNKLHLYIVITLNLVLSDWLSKRWTNGGRTVNALWIMSANGAEIANERTVNEPWAHSNVWKKWESRTFLGLYVNCKYVVLIVYYENALIEMWCDVYYQKRNSMALFRSIWFAIYMHNLM